MPHSLTNITSSTINLKVLERFEAYATHRSGVMRTKGNKQKENENTKSDFDGVQHKD